MPTQTGVCNWIGSGFGSLSHKPLKHPERYAYLQVNPALDSLTDTHWYFPTQSYS